MFSTQNHLETDRSLFHRLKTELLVVIALMLMCAGATHAAKYKLAIQPILPPDQIKAQYQALADYLSAETGSTITLSTFNSFKSYYANMKRKKGFDMVLDAAHFTDYRIQRMNYKALVKLPDTVSYSLVTGEELFVFDAEELIPYKIATMLSPSIGGLRLKEIYPDPKNSPTILRATDTTDAVNQIKDGRADAAMIPTPMVSNFEGLNTVLTTAPIQHIAFSVSPNIPKALTNKIKQALIHASEKEEGRKMFETLGFSGFIPTSNETYDGYAKILEFQK